MKVKVEYLYNSGFTIETDNHFLVIDYYKGNLQIPNKNTTFFVTHHHLDHYNKEIFKYESAKFVLSDDITDVDKNKNIIFVHEDESIILFNDLEIMVFGSTDEGSSFLITVDGLNIFHSGDLNWWAWEDMGPQRESERKIEYISEINKLIGLNIDIAFVPVDPELKHNYFLAGEYFINNIKPKFFFPMHFGDNYNCNEKFIHKMKGCDTHIFNVDKINQKFSLKL